MAPEISDSLGNGCGFTDVLFQLIAPWRFLLSFLFLYDLRQGKNLVKEGVDYLITFVYDVTQTLLAHVTAVNNVIIIHASHVFMDSLKVELAHLYFHKPQEQSL